jgi:hypothetical protein
MHLINHQAYMRRTLLLFGLLVIGLTGLAGWGSYTFYRMGSDLGGLKGMTEGWQPMQHRLYPLEDLIARPMGWLRILKPQGGNRESMGGQKPQAEGFLFAPPDELPPRVHTLQEAPPLLPETAITFQEAPPAEPETFIKAGESARRQGNEPIRVQDLIGNERGQESRREEPPEIERAGSESGHLQREQEGAQIERSAPPHTSSPPDGQRTGESVQREGPKDGQPEAVDRPNKSGEVKKPQKPRQREALENPRPSRSPRRVEHPERPARVERPEAPTRIERVEKPERIERVEKPERIERVEKPERIERVEKPERIERVEKPERIERVEKPERIERVEKPERIERVEKPERIERVEKPERIERPEKVLRPGKH